MSITGDEFSACKSKAISNVADLDQVDGWKDRDLGTILAALECGLKHPETNAAFDALVMLEDRVRRTRKETIATK